MGFSFTKIAKINCHFPGRRLPARYYLLILVLFFCLHLILYNIHESYRATFLSKIAPAWLLDDKSNSGSACFNTSATMIDQWPHPGHLPQLGCANATFVILARNDELTQLVKSLSDIEARFNHRHHYPYVFLNDEPFTDHFKNLTSNIVSSKVAYGLIPHDHWNQPDSIDEEKARLSRLEMVADKVIYGGSVSYRNMCRFNSGFFFRQELLQQYRYYWRIEPGVSFMCDIDEDPIMFLQKNNKVYGFTLALYEWPRTIPTLWSTVMNFIKENPQYISPKHAMQLLSDDDGKSYSGCHFWSNFEIADMNFWRSEAYMKYFEYLDSTGGFYYERWGDAPVHSIAVSLFARKDQIHMFREIGYRHPPYEHCPMGELHTKGKCSCNEEDNFDYGPSSCLNRYEKLNSQL